MKWLSAVIVAVAVFLPAANEAAFNKFQLGYNANTRIQKNLVSDYGATCNGVADDTSAFLAFKAANQGATPVQLNLPVGTCTFTPISGAGSNFVIGVLDLVLAGAGSGSTTIKNIAASQNMAFGSDGQTNNNSLPTNTANAGDSCVILKTAPSITISNAAPTIAPTATFNASASGTTLTVNSVASGTLVSGMQIRPVANDSRTFLTIVSQSTGPAGGAGTYVLGSSFTTGATTYISAPASFTADVDATGLMTVSAVADGAITVGDMVFSADNKYGGTGTQIGQGITTVKSQLTGPAGGAGTYQLDNITARGGSGNAPQPVASQAFHTSGQIRLTVNSTAGLTSGDTIFISSVTGSNELQNRVNGLKWIKVVDGTHLDLFQFSFEGFYTSGGVAGGDRTSLTPVGSTVLMTGFALQTYWGAPYGFPSNPHFFEWKTVQSVNSSTHQVCFTTPLANAYKDTWPRYNTGLGQFQVDPGGPATLYPILSSWDLTHVYRDFTLDNQNGQTGAGGRSVTWQNVAMAGVDCAIPSQNETYSWINVSAAGCNIETDKMVGTWNINNSSLNLVVVQSTSFGTVNITNGSVIKQWSGSSKVINIDASSFVPTGGNAGLSLGATAYGVSTTASVTNSAIGNSIGSGGPVQSVINQPWSMTGGVITIPNAYSFDACCNLTELQIRGMAPGSYAHWLGAGGGGTSAQRGRAFKIVDITQDLTNTYVTTSEAGGFPTGAWTTNGISVAPHPAPVFTASGNTGPLAVTAFNGCSSLPMFSCQNVTFTGGATGTTTVYFPILWGEPTTWTFTNNVPYTNTGSLTWTLSQFSNWQMLTSGLTTTNLPTETINTKLPSSAGGGTRTLTVSGATGTQASDSLTAWTAGAILGGAPPSGPVFSANTPSDSPQVTVTLRTDQHLP